MNKIIALNWKHTQTSESARELIKTVEDVRNIYPDFNWVVFPGDDLLPSFLRRQESRPETVA
jgi:triosephosphate isomerase